ncbi:peptidoglycan-binding protein [Actinophytocola sp. S1-96]|uniref:Peptidoglycan-binding protein n=2 Tax=Actinophytocola gossypii TaxID=2812003 RepID=A0ABT2J346_9PSEU|nr:peptidoglycan-binding protein [Actinophytocola gossypii]
MTGVLLVVGAGAATAVRFGGDSDAAQPASDLPPATAEVTKQTLVDQEVKDGTLGYGSELSLSPKPSGTTTWLPGVGTVVRRGDVLYRVDELPVVLMYGKVPAYRDLSSGAEGSDVAQLEENLAALGYTGFTVDDTFTDATATAVESWQEDNGLTETGTVELGRVAFATGEIRVSALNATIGDAAQPGQALLTYTGTTRLITVTLDVDEQRLAKEGTKVPVTLPDGKEVEGTVSEVLTVFEPAQSEDEESSTTIEVTVSVADQKTVSRFDQASVSVGFTAAERENVLTVPVSALLALAEGGYGVEVVRGSSTRIVAVEVGLFSGGRVEVSGDTISAGTKVGVPS